MAFRRQRPGWSAGAAGRSSQRETGLDRLRQALRDTVGASIAEFSATFRARRQALSAQVLTSGELILDFLCTPLGRTLVAIAAVTGAWALL
jgi:hypothetical protein